MTSADTTSPLSSREALLRMVLRVQERKNAAGRPSATKSKIVATAMSMFTKTGYAGTSMRDIAAQVGIKAASLYSHFPDGKAELLAVGLHSILDEFHAFVIEDIRFDLSPRDQLRAVIGRHVRWQLDLGETAVAWDAAINQFGVAGALPDSTLDEIHREQSLYLDFVYALVVELNRGASSPADVSAALLLLCNGAHRFLAPEWRTAETVPPDQRNAAIEQVWTLITPILGLE